MRERGRAVALLWDDREFTFADLEIASARVAAGLLAHGVKPGDRVAVGLPNSPGLFAAVLGVLRSGAVLVPLNPAYTGDEVRYIAADSGAAVAIVHDQQAVELRTLQGIAALAQLPDAAPTAMPSPAADEAALIVYTSGTTGRPKGAVLAHRALLANLSTVTSAWRWTAADRLLLTLPCFHLHGLGLGILASMLVGSSVVLRPRFVADEIPTLLAHRACTMFFGVPTMYNRLVALPDEAFDGVDLRGMRLWVSGSAPLTPVTFERFRQRFGRDIVERFGMSEGGFMISAPLGEPLCPGVVGRPLPGIDIELIDPAAADDGRFAPVANGEPGEIAIRGPNLFSGYWRRPEDTARAFIAGYFRSGDLAVRGADGMIRIVGRISLDIIKSHGFKIGALEIESCLQSHPAVAEAAVVGIPDRERGEAVVAAITWRGGSAVEVEELRDFARRHLAPHKVPVHIVALDEIPRTGPGKFDKRRLAAGLIRMLD